MFSFTLVSAAFTPALAGATPGGTSHTAPGQAPSASNGVNHNDTPPAGNSNCSNSGGTSGNCSMRQPYSNADSNNTGANDTTTSNQYRSTRKGAASDNGNGNGQATGRPCAGCVGKADNKNPPGQAPNGAIDHNNGYECDGNNGIGQTNPAHTGCTTPPPSTGGGCTPGQTTNGCGTGGGSGGGECTPSTANHNCDTPGDTCTPTSGGAETGAGDTCEIGGTGGGSNGGGSNVGGSTVGGAACTAGTSGCTLPACSTATAPVSSPAACSTSAVLALDGSRPAGGVLSSSAVPATPMTPPAAASVTPAPPATPTVVAAVGGTRSLPFTGIDLQTLTLVAIGLAIAGAGIATLGRRRRDSLA